MASGVHTSYEFHPVGITFESGFAIEWRGLRSDLTKLGLKGPVGLVLGAEFTGPKATSLGQGSAHWNRTSLIVGPLFRAYLTPSWALSLWLVRGEGFDEDRRNFSSAVGANIHRTARDSVARNAKIRDKL